MSPISSRLPSSASDRLSARRPSAAPSPDRWERFVAEHGSQLQQGVAAAMYRLGWPPEPADVDDLTQEVYCRLLTSPRQLAAIESVPRPRRWAYLHRIARSVVVDELRTRHARKRGGSERRAELRESIPAPLPPPDERILVREQARLVARLVHGQQGRELGERNLRILRMAAVEGYTSSEISRRFDGALTASSVCSILCRLRQLLASETATMRGRMTPGNAAGRVVSSRLAAARSTRCS